MNTELTANFEDKMEEYIKEGFGQLLAKEDIHRLIYKSIDKLMFTGTTKTVGSGYNKETVAVPPMIETVVSELLERHIKLEAKKAIAANSDVIRSIMDEALSKGIGVYALAAFNDIATNSMINLKFQLMNDIQANLGARL